MQASTKPNKSVIITGGNSGLGYACAEAISRSGQDWHIIIASRNLSRVAAAVDTLITETDYAQIEGMILDLASLASVRQFSQDIITGERPPLQAIICNAGVHIISDTRHTADGFETSKAVGSDLARLILDPALEHTTGKYFNGLEEIRSSTESYNLQEAAELWESSMELVKLSAKELTFWQMQSLRL